ncbi:MAG: Fic family protein [Fusobacteriaceae bacterium]|nr:Fic family protein [Fusobacteriaceae bacterium]
MNKKEVKKQEESLNLKPDFLFKSKFLSTFSISLKSLPFDDALLRKVDEAISVYEKREIDSHLESALRLRNNVLTSFAVSKAENSALTLAEATELYNHISFGKEDFPKSIKNKIKKKEKLNKNDHDRLEYYNIAKTFKTYEGKISIDSLSLNLIKKLHKDLTIGLDIFAGIVSDFETYNSGKLRDNDKVRVANYEPAPFKEVEESLKELIYWLKTNPSATNIFIFHTALYAIHPFRNGNKRVCRVLEHFLLQSIGYNSKNLYATSYYYHDNQKRYYSRLIEAMYKHNLKYFVAFAQEALYFSALGVIAEVLQRKRAEFLDSYSLNKGVKSILKPLIKRGELRFSRLFALNKRKVVRQTFVNYLKEAELEGVLKKRELGKAVFYSLALDFEEDRILKDWKDLALEKGAFLPDKMR